MQKPLKIGIIGGGNLGSAIAEGLAASDVLPSENITISRRRMHLLEYLKKEDIRITDNNKVVVENNSIIIIAVKPHQLMEILREISTTLDPNKHLVISAVTGVSIKEIRAIIPKVPVFRAMPNTAIALRESMTCIAGDETRKESFGLIKEIFSRLGEVVVINEELMGAATVTGACGIAFALRFMRAMSQGGIEIGFGSELSQFITAQTIKGASKLILESGNHPEREIDKVTTPQGITISGLNEMEHQGFSSSVIKGLITSHCKLERLAEQKKNGKK
ncbi:MAG: pyrroline-5-carboxylate reductase [Bacteroidota bacterium]